MEHEVAAEDEETGHQRARRHHGNEALIGSGRKMPGHTRVVVGHNEVAQVVVSQYHALLVFEHRVEVVSLASGRLGKDAAAGMVSGDMPVFTSLDEDLGR